MSVVEFPGLGIEMNVPRVAFELFGIPIYWYGVCIGVGMLLAMIFAFRKSESVGVDSDRMIDVIAIGLLLAIIGGRLYFVIFSDGDYSTLREIVHIRAGGIAIYGGIIGGFVGAAIGCKWRKVPMLPMFDLAGIGFLIGQACGRWGNFFNQEAFGTNTTLPWGMISPETTAYLASQQAKLATEGILVDPLMPVHPTFLYESLWCLLGFVLLALYLNKRRFNGEVFLMYIMWYGLGRTFIEGLRTDSLMIQGLGMRVSQVLAATSVLVAFAMWIFARVRTAGKPLVVPVIPPRTEKIRIQTESGEQQVEISWPANDKAPSKQEKIEIANTVWKASQEEKQSIEKNEKNSSEDSTEEQS